MSTFLFVFPPDRRKQDKLIYDEPSSGFSQGIEADLKYLQCNEDKYQLLIRKYIVKELGKDVNGLIKTDFESDNGKTVYLIVVPTYHQIVVFKDKVWQRQGNFTRPLDHSALKFLKEWRTVTKISGQISTAEVEVGHLIPTSRLNRMDDERITIAYFSILASGKYVITTDDPYRNDARITLPIYEDNRDGYLLQIYTNGYVNRVAISTILSKNRDYKYTYALFGNAVITFINKNDFLCRKTTFKGEGYIKVKSLEWIKFNVDLSRQGTPLFSISFERINIEMPTSKQAKEVESLKNESPTTLGSLMSSLSVVKEVIHLNNLLNPSESEEKEESTSMF